MALRNRIPEEVKEYLLNIPRNKRTTYLKAKQEIFEKFGYVLAKHTFNTRRELKLKTSKMPDEVTYYLWTISEETSYKEANAYTMKNFGYVLPHYSYKYYSKKNSKIKDYNLCKIDGKLYRRNHYKKYDFDIYGYIKELALKYNYNEIQEILEKDKGIKLTLMMIRRYANQVQKSHGRFISEANKIYKKIHPNFNYRDGNVFFLDNDTSNTNEDNLLFVERNLLPKFVKFDIKKFSPEEKKTAYLTIQLEERIKELETITGKNKILNSTKQEKQDKILKLLSKGYSCGQTARELQINNYEVTFYRRRLKALGLLK